MKHRKIAVGLLTAAGVCAGLAVLSACTKKHVHEFGAWETVTEATCTAAGRMKRVCACGAEDSEEIAAKGHDWTWQTTERDHVRTCKNGCGETKDGGAHAFSTDNGCTVCGYALPYTATLTYGEIKDGETTVAYAVSGHEGELESIVVPAYHEGLPVTEIADYAFYADGENGGNANCKLLKSITLPETVTRIGIYAFGECEALAEVKTSAQITVLDKGAFYTCPQLTQIEIGDKVETVGDYAFYATGIKQAVLPAFVQSVGKQAFQMCDSLERVTFECAPTFGDYVFWRCPNLKTVVVDHNETVFKKNMFYEFADASVDFIVGDKVTSVAERMMGGSTITNIDYAKSITIGKNVTEIKESAFAGCRRVEGTIVIPDGVTSIGALAFSYCSAAEKIVLPKSVTSIGAGAFATWSAVKQVEYGGTVNEWSQIDFGNNLSNPLKNGTAKLVISGKEVNEIVFEGVEEIKEYAFYGLEITKLTFGESVKRIGQEAFARDSKAETPKIGSLTILSKAFSAVTLAFNNALGDDTEIYYKGTAEEMEENAYPTGAINVHHFAKGKHYFYSETPQTEAVETDGRWTFGGYWKFTSDGKTVEKTDVAAQ